MVYKRRQRSHLFAVLLTLLFLAPAIAPAQKPTEVAANSEQRRSRVIVIPAGQKSALLPTTRVASALVKRLNDRGKISAEINYFAPDATAEPTDRELAEQLLTRARQAFQALDFDEVRTFVARVVDRLKLAIEAGKTTKAYAEAMHLLAATELFDSNADAALNAMRNAVLFSPKAPAKRRYNPTVQELFKRVRAEKATAKLQIQSSPTALLWVDNVFYGLSNKKVALRPGLHCVRVFRPGFMPWSEWIQLSPGQNEQIATKLQPASITEPLIIRKLRQAASAPIPTSVVKRVSRRYDDAEVIVIYTEAPCSSQRCDIRLRWAQGNRWKRSAGAVLRRNAVNAAAQLLGDAPPMSPIVRGLSPKAQRCALDSDCGHEQSCNDGLCTKDTSIFKSWWFWTAVGVVAAGAATGTALIFLTKTETPVINIQ